MPSGNSPSPPDGFGVADGRLKLPARVALAALHLNVISHELPLATVQIPRDGFALCKMIAGALTLGAAPSEIGIFLDIAALADVRFAPEAVIARTLDSIL